MNIENNHVGVNKPQYESYNTLFSSRGRRNGPSFDDSIGIHDEKKEKRKRFNFDFPIDIFDEQNEDYFQNDCNDCNDCNDFFHQEDVNKVPIFINYANNPTLPGRPHYIPIKSLQYTPQIACFTNSDATIQTNRPTPLPGLEYALPLIAVSLDRDNGVENGVENVVENVVEKIDLTQSGFFFDDIVSIGPIDDQILRLFTPIWADIIYYMYMNEDQKDGVKYGAKYGAEHNPSEHFFSEKSNQNNMKIIPDLLDSNNVSNFSLFGGPNESQFFPDHSLKQLQLPKNEQIGKNKDKNCSNIFEKKHNFESFLQTINQDIVDQIQSLFNNSIYTIFTIRMNINNITDSSNSSIYTPDDYDGDAAIDSNNIGINFNLEDDNQIQSPTIQNVKNVFEKFSFDKSTPDNYTYTHNSYRSTQLNPLNNAGSLLKPSNEENNETIYMDGDVNGGHGSSPERGATKMAREVIYEDQNGITTTVEKNGKQIIIQNDPKKVPENNNTQKWKNNCDGNVEQLYGFNLDSLHLTPKFEVSRNNMTLSSVQCLDNMAEHISEEIELNLLQKSNEKDDENCGSNFYSLNQNHQSLHSLPNTIESHYYAPRLAPTPVLAFDVSETMNNPPGSPKK